MARSCKTSSNSCSPTWPLARRNCGLRCNLVFDFTPLYALHDVCLREKHHLLSPAQPCSSALFISPAHQPFSSALLVCPAHQPCSSALLISPSCQPFLSALQLLTCTCLRAYTCRIELTPVTYSAWYVMQCCTCTQDVLSDHQHRSGCLWLSAALLSLDDCAAGRHSVQAAGTAACGRHSSLHTV